MKFRSPLTAAAISMAMTFLQLSLFGHVTVSEAASGCDGGQGEGDKWFDGCRWCVCEESVEVCSSSTCSEINAKLPPCETVGSSWWDGCYQCKCLPYGIECKADRTCVARMPTPGVCTEPRDSRCVCGVDGVPSCTADAIDRNALQATTISVKPVPRNPPRMRPQRPFPRSSLRRPRPRPSRPSGYRSSIDNSRRITRPRPFRRFRGELRRRLRMRRSVGDFAAHWGQTLEGYGGSVPNVQRVVRKRRCVDCDDDGEDLELLKRKTREAEPTVPTLSVDNEQSPSLLVSAHNRCRWGSRWYGGSLRCYCDHTGTITCGDPRFVASRIDGFLMDTKRCSQGETWRDHGSCRFCECHTNGVAFCWRAESCPYPFLIAPVVPTEGIEGSSDDGDSLPDDQDDDDDDDDDEVEERNDNGDFTSDIDGGLRRLAGRVRPGLMLPPPEEDLPGSGDDSAGVLTPHQQRPRPRPRTPRPAHRMSGVGSARHSTTVIVRECRPGRRWRDGCLRCECVGSGKKQCNDDLCLKSPSISGNAGASSGEDNSVSMFQGRPIQRPPSNWSSRRDRPLPPVRPVLNTSCGKFQLNEIYHIDECNICKCLPQGPICTAQSC